ncbi:MAG: putative cytokinetic ring protein SteA [Dermatophilaceae bacterium]
MKTRLRHRAAGAPPPGATGRVRVDRRTKNLTKRLGAGEVAVIDHDDIDRVSAEALVACRPSLVVNAGRSITGRYPNVGPEILLEAGIPILDDAGPAVMERLAEDDWVEVEGDVVRRDGADIATGRILTLDGVREEMATAREGLSSQLEAFAQNTMEYLVREKDLLLDGVGVPEITTQLDGRHALIVVRGYHYKEDLQALQHYIREFKPVLIGVDGGADALLQAGHRPHLIVGDMDSVSDAALKSGAEIVVHAYRDGRAPGVERVQNLGIRPVVFPATGTSEDVAMLLADDKGATLIVAVGTHATLVEFLDKGRKGMASTFLTRLRVGSKLIDAKGVSRLYRTRISFGAILAMLLVPLLVLGIALSATPGGAVILNLLGARWDDLWATIVGVFT